ncbi:class I SAM-dependent methyltransferase [Shouchella shacheensis]|uniref:class I SAM-dependent methyltransferase n=1 Tax=Shouchella shacheensis TaxID=1649580 RepID=UPI0007405308|nr:methyltransferase domain-containing protein [Shouchella shacheensis]
MSWHKFTEERAHKLLDDKRRDVLTPDDAKKLLDVQEGETVADFGAGNGYFTLPLAMQTSAFVYAIDREVEMLNWLHARADAEELTNLVYVNSNLENIKVESGTIDKAIHAFVMHELPNKEKVLAEFKRLMKPSGKLVIFEWAQTTSEEGNRVPKEKMKELLEREGLKPTMMSLNDMVYAAVVEFS